MMDAWKDVLNPLPTNDDYSRHYVTHPLPTNDDYSRHYFRNASLSANCVIGRSPLELTMSSHVRAFISSVLYRGFPIQTRENLQ